VKRFSRRGALGATTLVIASVLTVLAATSVSAAPSRASSRWNHVATPPANSLTTDPAESGTEPAIRGPVWKTIRLVERYGPRFTFVDVAPKGGSPGDYGVFRDAVFTRDGVRVGTIDAQCIASYSDQCDGSIRLTGRGQITFAGITPLGRDPDHYAITGGTGQFAGVGGELMIEFPDFDRARLTIRLTR
jgi:hypothetical protein